MKRGTLKRKRKEVDVEAIERQKEFFMEIWERKSHYCQSCSKWLGKEPNLLFFHHVLPKHLFKEFKYNEKNIVILCWNCHASIENGFCNEKLQNIIDDIKEELQ